MRLFVYLLFVVLGVWWCWLHYAKHRDARHRRALMTMIVVGPSIILLHFVPASWIPVAVVLAAWLFWANIAQRLEDERNSQIADRME